MISDKITIYGKEFNNRVVFQPMEGCDGTPDGAIDTLTRRRYMRFAESGAGLIWFEAIAVIKNGRANPRQLYITKENLNTFKALISDMKNKSLELFGYAPIIVAQLTHSGRYSKPNGTPEPIIVYHNDLWEKGKENQPYHVITDEEIDELPSYYANAAKLAHEAGFDGVDIKSCHGYLMNEFLSAYSRKGKYGGSFENRTRLYFDVIDTVKNAIPKDMFITTRLSAYDGFPYPYGFAASEKSEIDLFETKKILEILQSKGIELVNITIGNPYLIPHVNRPSTQGAENGEIGLERVKLITNELQKTFPNINIIMSALSFPGVNAVDYADSCLKSGVCKLTGFGRMTFAYPSFYQDYLKSGTLDKNKVCLKCGNCTKLMRAGTVSGCPMRDKEIYLPIFKEYVK